MVEDGNLSYALWTKQTNSWNRLVLWIQVINWGIIYNAEPRTKNLQELTKVVLRIAQGWFDTYWIYIVRLD